MKIYVRESQIYEFEEIFIEYIRKCFKLYINNINQNEDKVILETPYEIMEKNFRNVNKRVFNDLIESIKIYRKKRPTFKCFDSNITII